jgi:hypothetical protein
VRAVLSTTEFVENCWREKNLGCGLRRAGLRFRGGKSVAFLGGSKLSHEI